MAYKDLLVHVDDAKSQRGTGARGGRAGDRARGPLVGVYIIADPAPSSFVTGHVPADVLDMLQRQARERADAALARFAEVAKRNQISFETRLDRVLYTAMADALATNARYADLAILGQADPDDGDVASTCPRR